MDFMFKRLVILSGHYGSGKTNIAVNLAFALKKSYNRVAVADIDIVNPYFRTKDSEKALADAGIRLICSKFANTNLDLPALPDELYAVTADKDGRFVVDVGGDDRGALALGRLTDAVLAENDYEMLFVVNKFRPLTRTAADAAEVMLGIERAARLPFTAIVNNSNLGVETKPEDVIGSLDYANEVARLTGLPVKMTAVCEKLQSRLEGRIPNMFPMKLMPRAV